MENKRVKTNNENNDFIRSVFMLTSDDIITEKKKKSFKDIVFGNIRRIILLICAVVLLVSLSFIVKSMIHYRRTDKVYKDIENIMMGDGINNGVLGLLSSKKNPASPDYDACQNLSSENLDDITDIKPVNPEFERMKIKLLSLKELYPDLYGWVTLPNTPINYPIMQCGDNDYYLTHSYTGELLTAGSVFADYRCSKTLLSNYNLILYGHHMLNGSIFKHLDDFNNEDFFRNNNKIYIYTLDGMYTYSVFSVYETFSYYNYIQTYFPSTDSFSEFGSRVADNSIYKVDGLTFGENDRILTLSTCTNRHGDTRLAVHARLESFTN